MDDSAKAADKLRKSSRTPRPRFEKLRPKQAEYTQAKEALQYSRGQWEDTFNAISDWIVLIDLKGQILRTNLVGEKFTGVSLDEIVGQSCCRLIHGPEKHIPGCPMIKMVRTGQRATGELQVPNTNRWIMVTVDPLTDEKGNVTGAVHITREITERKKTEQVLRDSEEKYRAIFEQAVDSIVLIDGETGALLEFNERTHEILGYTREEFRRLKIPDFEVIESSEEVDKHIKKIIKEGADIFETKHRTKDGQIQDIMVSSRAISMGNRDFCLSIWRDITERKKAEQALKLSEQRYALAQRAANIGTWESNLQDGKTYWSGQTDALFGLARGRFKQTRDAFYELVHPDDRRYVIDSANACIEEGKSYDIEHRIVWPDGTVRWVAQTGDVVRDQNGKPIRLHGIVQDITERRRMEQMLRESEKLAAAGQLAARIAHEINNPLAGIKNAFLLIKDAVPTDHPYYEYVGRIEDEISRLGHIVHQMYDLYRPNAESPCKFNLRQTIDDIIALMKVSGEEYNVNIEVDVASDAVVELVEGLFRELLFNIIRNAVEASPPNKTVNISAKVSKKHLTVQIADEGPGIEKEIQDRIFEPFFTTKSGRANSGLGIGLSVCKSAVDAMGGSITFETKKGKGTVFTAIIPLKTEPVETKNGYIGQDIAR